MIAAVISLLVLLGFATLVQTQANGYQQQIVVLVFIYSMVAVALAVTSGFTGVFSLGQIGFLAIGAYVSAVIVAPGHIRYTGAMSSIVFGAPAGDGQRRR